MVSGVRHRKHSETNSSGSLEELHRILESSEFHSSPRCQEFLRHIVEHCVAGASDLLKERNIGVDVFHRSASYDPNNDAIVRVRATEVRKRLHQYYDHAGAESGVRIALVAGSYVPEFHWVRSRRHRHAAPPVPVEMPEMPAEAPRRKRMVWIAGGMVGVLLALAIYLQFRAQSTPLHDFWKSSLTSGNPVVICLGQPVVYHLSRRVHDNYLKTQPKDRLPGPYVIPLKDGDVGASDILPVPDQYVGAGSAQTAAKLSALLAGWKKPMQVRVGNEYSFYDLRDHPAVLVGAFNNDWTMKLSQRMPLVFHPGAGCPGNP